MAEATLIPNTFQHPNAYVDWLSYYLTPEEEKVLNKAIREIIGWHNKIESRRARIALSIFVDGKFQDRKRVCMGCGLSRDAVRKALNVLNEFRILLKCGQPTNDGQEYELNLSYDSLDWDKIKGRRTVWDQQNRDKTRAARETLKESRHKGGTVGQYARGVLSDSTKETQDSLETQIAAPKNPTREPDPVKEEPEYVDEPFDDDNPHSKKRPKWQIPETIEQEGFLAACNAKWFLPKQKHRVKGILAAVRAGDVAGEDVYQRVMDHIGGMTEIVEVPPLLPPEWYKQRLSEAAQHHWRRDGLIGAILSRDKLMEFCQLKQRELDRIPESARYVSVEEAERRAQGPVTAVITEDMIRQMEKATGLKYVGD